MHVLDLDAASLDENASGGRRAILRELTVAVRRPDPLDILRRSRGREEVGDTEVVQPDDRAVVGLA